MATDCYLIAMCRPFACRFGNHWQPLAEEDDIGQDERDHFESRSKQETGRESENWWKGVKRKINKNLVSISQCLEASWKCRHAPPTAQLTICLAPTPSQQLPLIHLKAPLTTKRHRNQPELAVAVPPPPPTITSTGLEDDVKREVREKKRSRSPRRVWVMKTNSWQTRVHQLDIPGTLLLSLCLFWSRLLRLQHC